MVNLDGPKGFIPVTMLGGIIPARLYAVDADGSVAMYIGDMVVRSSDGKVDQVTGATGNPVLGAVMALYDSDMIPVTNSAASTAGFALVADDPMQEFIAQEDSAGGSMALTDRGANVNIVVGSADTFSNRSGHEIDSTSPTTTAGHQLRIVDIHDVSSNAVGTNAKWIVRINNHQASPGIVGVGI